MIQVFSKNYRDSCLPYTEDVVKEVSTALPVIAVKRNEDLLTIIKVIYLLFKEAILYIGRMKMILFTLKGIF